MPIRKKAHKLLLKTANTLTRYSKRTDSASLRHQNLSPSLDSLSTDLCEAWGLNPEGFKIISRQLRRLAASRLIWLLPPVPNPDANPLRYTAPFRQILTALADPHQSWRVICPLLEPVPATGSALAGQRLKPVVINYLVSAAQGKELAGVLYEPEHLRQQLDHWGQLPSPQAPLLIRFAQLKGPFRQLISPHPLFDCSHYARQRLALGGAAPAPDRHPIVDYLIGCTLSHRFRALEPSAQFNPCLWQLGQARAASPPGSADQPSEQAPLVQFLAAMNSATSSCPIGIQKLAGVVDGIDGQAVLRGWCRSRKPGQPVELEVWINGVLLGTGLADQPRSDVASLGIEMRNCGFAIPLNLDGLPLDLLHDLPSARWQVVTTDQQATLGRGDWRLNEQDRLQVAEALSQRSLQAGEQAVLRRSLEQLSDRPVAEGIRRQLFNWCAVSATAGVWDPTPLLLLQKATLTNPVLQQGVDADSCSRAELLLLALHQLHRHWSGFSARTDDGTDLAGSCAALADQLAERCYFGPTTRERQCWDAHLRPLFNLVIATLLLQETPTELGPTAPLLASLVRLSQEVFGDLQLARTLTALFTPERGPGDSAALRLQLRSGDALGVAIALFHQRGMGLDPKLSPFDQALALLEISKQSLSTIEVALARLLPLIPAQQARTPRSSFCRRLLDQLGWHVNTLSAGLIDQLIANNAPQALGLAVRERTISLLSQISQALWAGDDGRSGCMPLPRSTKPPLRWLLIGERALPQCWLYRVEQKRQQLERCGAEVRCIDKGDLDAWSFSQQVAWADAVIFCRTPATYGVIRALTFARHCGKRVFADIDDLVFSSAFPAPYITYGGAISRSIHRRLGLDAPLQRWPLEQADAVITSTAALADACRGASAALANKPITVLPNLPLPELLGLARRLAHQPPQRAPRLVVSSGTLAHKQIWSDQLAPAIAQLLGNHPQLRLSLIGHLELPACLQPFSGRISTVPYSDYSHYLQHLAEGSIALVPLEDHPTTHCKSAIKWMEASLLGLATVCSPVRAYTDAATAEQHLLLAEDQQAWVHQVERLLADPALLGRLSSQARQHAQASFHEQLGEQIWNTQFLAASGDSSSTDHNPHPASPQRQKLLVINVFFAPQSFGGATRVAQDQVRDILKDHGDTYDVTVLCIDHDPWQDLTSDTLPLDLWHWHGARILRLAVPPRPWADIQDPRVESFCRQWFQDESFDLIHCHCTQVLTASPLVVAKQLGIPYLITLHDAWWLSPELFLVSPAGRQIDPAKPFDHIDGTPTPEEKAIALERRSILAGILKQATHRLAVSRSFRQVYERSGISDIKTNENNYTPMLAADDRSERQALDPLRICHVGGMAMHKGYHILYQAVHLLPANLNLKFTVIDHRLQEDAPPYSSSWNGYPVRFIPPIPMKEMARFYACQDVLVAPSIWPESFGLVTREALSAGLWVIASDIGALAEPIRDGVNGSCIRPNDCEALAVAILKTSDTARIPSKTSFLPNSQTSSPTNTQEAGDPPRSRIIHFYQPDTGDKILTRNRDLRHARKSRPVSSRYQMVEGVAARAMTGCWGVAAIQLAQEATLTNPVLQQGVEADSCSRAELLLLALHQLHRHWSGFSARTDDGTDLAGSCAALADQLAERCYFGPTTRERQCWDAHLRPLFNLVIATLLLQETPTELGPTAPLLASLVRLSQEVFGDLQLARTLTALFTPERGPGDSAALRLQLRSGDALGVAIALFHQRGMGLDPKLSPFDQALALLEISKQSLSTIEVALARLLPLIPAQQARTPRSSFCRRLLDQLGWHVNTLSAGLIDQLIANNAPQALGLAVRERTISLLSQISQALWAGDDGRSGCMPLPRSTKPPLRWLLIGERALPQCWLYRVEQKRQQLERCGAEVRCIDKGDLDAWSFSQQVAWADAVIFCRTPATYGVIRALTFARHCGKRVFADIDDLVFSSAFPAPYITYGGAISRSIHRRLGLDAPLQRWPLEQADAVITSTAALADACRGASAALANKPITVLPNLPLPELLGLARRLAHQPPQRAPRLVVSSGTLAHKQIWSDQLAPAIAQLLGNHPQLRLSLIGHLELPACLQPFSGRISTVPYSDYSHYLQHLAEGSIALVPLEDHPTTHCKSAIKWMEASLLGLATVCSPVRAYTDAATAEQHLLLAEDQQAWVHQVERLLADPALLGRLSSQARQHAQASFHEQLGEQIWNTQFLAASGDSSSTDHNPHPASPQRQKLLVINVFFAPQSFGGATRVAQDQVRDILKDHGDTYDVTVLCIDHDPWQDLTSDTLPLDLWHWHGARILRLAVPPRPWADIQDPRVESFCRQWFQDESFDLIHCHCTQVLTASPLVVAKQLGIPYLITLHDAWWLSPELFLVSPAGRQIDPAKPFDHVDGTPTPEEKAIALERRGILAGILRGAQQRLAVSDPFRKVYERAGVEEIDVRENQFTPMPPPQPRPPRRPGDPLRICHVGGMAMHKGYHILRQAVHLLPPELNLEFTVIDHRLQEDQSTYSSSWNGYPVRFLPPIPMEEMAGFYASQDVLVAASIWPESFGLVTREALSAGVFVICSNIGALGLPIKEPSQGIAVRAGEPIELANAMASITRSQDHQKALNNRRHAQ